MESLDKTVKSLHPGLRRFVNQAFELINLNRFFEKYKIGGGILDGYHLHVHLIQWFLNLEIVFDREYHQEYDHIRFVKDLPEKDIVECLFYMNYLMGTTEYTGGHDYIDIYQKMKNKLSS
jgi:hypothetical protein